MDNQVYIEEQVALNKEFHLFLQSLFMSVWDRTFRIHEVMDFVVEPFEALIDGCGMDSFIEKIDESMIELDSEFIGYPDRIKQCMDRFGHVSEEIVNDFFAATAVVDHQLASVPACKKLHSLLEEVKVSCSKELMKFNQIYTIFEIERNLLVKFLLICKEDFNSICLKNVFLAGGEDDNGHEEDENLFAVTYIDKFEAFVDACNEFRYNSLDIIEKNIKPLLNSFTEAQQRLLEVYEELAERGVGLFDAEKNWITITPMKSPDQYKLMEQTIANLQENEFVTNESFSLLVRQIRKLGYLVDEYGELQIRFDK